MRHCCFLPSKSPLNRNHLNFFLFFFQNKWISRSPMLQRRVYHSMAAVQRKLYVLGGNDLDYNNDRILVRHIDSYNIDTDQWTRCNFNLLTGKYLWLTRKSRDSSSCQTCFLKHLSAALNMKCMMVKQLALITQKCANRLSHKVRLSQVAKHLVSRGLYYFVHVAKRGFSSPLVSINIHVGRLIPGGGTRCWRS